MKKITLKALHCIFVLLFALHFARPVFAHGSEPRLEISADRLNPGAVLQVRGVDFEYEEEVAVALVNSTTAALIISFGTIIADVEGAFTLNVTLPADLPEGVYVLRATTDDHETLSPPFTVWGTAILEQESNIGRDQSDVQFESLPTLQPGIAPTVAEQTAPAAKTSSIQNLISIITIFLLAVGIFTLFVLRMNRTRK